MTTEGDHPALQDEIYHAPGDRMELIRVDAFTAFGRVAERMVRTLDTITIPRGDAGVRLPDGRSASGWPLRAAQAGLFLPLLIATLVTARRDPWRRGAGETLRRFVILLATYGTVRALPALGLLPGYELYPPPPKHPLLYQPQVVPMLVPLLVGIALALIVARVWRPPALEAPQRRSGALLALTVLVFFVLWENPFTATTFLLLPAWLWVWVAPGSIARTVLNAGLLVAGWAVVGVLILVQTTLLFGAHLPWYFLMGTAYGQFTAARWLASLALIAIWTQLVQVATHRAGQ